MGPVEQWFGKRDRYTLDQRHELHHTFKAGSDRRSFLIRFKRHLFSRFASTGLPICTDSHLCIVRPRRNPFQQSPGLQCATSHNQLLNRQCRYTDFQYERRFAAVSGTGRAFFRLGLPFFYGRNVYTAIEGSSTPVATSVLGVLEIDQSHWDIVALNQSVMNK